MANEKGNVELIEAANANLSFLKAELYRIVNSQDNLCSELFDKMTREFKCHCNV
jgi:hypothetical protein